MRGKEPAESRGEREGEQPPRARERGWVRREKKERNEERVAGDIEDGASERARARARERERERAREIRVFL